MQNNKVEIHDIRKSLRAPRYEAPNLLHFSCFSLVPDRTDNTREMIFLKFSSRFSDNQTITYAKCELTTEYRFREVVDQFAKDSINEDQPQIYQQFRVLITIVKIKIKKPNEGGWNLTSVDTFYYSSRRSNLRGYDRNATGDRCWAGRSGRGKETMTTLACEHLGQDGRGSKSRSKRYRNRLYCGST